jgi:protein gp37
MATKTTIEWTEMSWNPVTGCTKVSQGCKNCYAERMALRLKAMGQKRYRNGFSVTLQKDMLNQPDKWLAARTIFVNSMSDLFHEDVPISFIKKVFETIHRNPHHTFQVLTKRSERLSESAKVLSWPHNLWIGVSVENSENLYRVGNLQTVPAAVRFLSCEPLLGPLCDIPLAGIHWVIVGGESGPGARPMRESWVESIRKQCSAKGVAFFFKQWGGVRKKNSGRKLHGRTYDEMPNISLSRSSSQRPAVT